MNRWKPCRRSVFIRRLREVGFDGPYSGAKHQFMTFENHRLSIPSSAEYSIPQLRMMMREVAEIIGREVSASEWNSL